MMNFRKRNSGRVSDVKKKVMKKRELLKLKQGIISESEVIEQDVHEQPEKADCCQEKSTTFSSAIKWFVAAGAFFAAVGFSLCIRQSPVKQPDLTVILAVSDTSKLRAFIRRSTILSLRLKNTVPTLTATDMFTLQFTA